MTKKSSRMPQPSRETMPPRRLARLALFVLLAAAALVLVWFLGDIFAPVFAALALAYMLDPLVNRLEERGWPRRRAVVAVFAGLILVMVILLGVSVPFIVRDVAYAVGGIRSRLEEVAREEPSAKDEDAAPSGEEAAPPRPPGFTGKFLRAARRSETGRKLLEWAEESRLFGRALEWLQENASEVAERTLIAAKGGLAYIVRLGWLLLMVALFPVYLYFFMVGLDSVQDGALSMVPASWRLKTERIAAELGTMLSAFFRGRLVVAFAIGVFTAAGFAIVGLRFGIIFGIAIGIASIVPFLNVVFLVPALLVALIDFQSFWWMAAVFGIYAAGQGLDPLLMPYLLSRGTGLHPVTIIVSLLVWGRLLGTVGLLLAVPLTAAVKVLGREIVLPVLAGGEVAADAAADAEEAPP